MEERNPKDAFGAPGPGRSKQGGARRPDGPAKPARAPSQAGAPRDAIPVLVLLANSQVAFLDRISVGIREQTGRSVKRAALIRAMVDAIQEAGLSEVLVNQTDSEQAVKEKLKERLAARK